MEWYEALILGIVQGLTEFLPISSSGHLEIASYILKTNPSENLMFTVIVHIATARGRSFEARIPRARGRATPKMRESANVEVVLEELKWPL